MNVEAMVTGGLATWLEGFRHDPARAEVEFRTWTGSASVPRRRALFSEVAEYREEPFDPALAEEPSVLEALIGLDAHPRGATTWYVIHTTAREATFYTTQVPQVEFLDDAGPVE